MSDQNQGSGVTGSAARFAVGKLFMWLFGGTGLLIGGVVVVVIALVFMVGMGIGGGQEDKSSSDGNTSFTCTLDGDSAIPAEYRQFTIDAASESRLPVSIIAAQTDQESSWNPRAVSIAGAMGLSQFMPGTWAQFGEGDPFDPKAAMKARGKYMAYLRDWVKAEFPKIYKDDGKLITDEKTIALILAAYNAGPGNVHDFGGVPPFPETQNYVTVIPKMAQEKYSDNCEAEFIGEIGTGKWVHPNPGARMMSPFGPRNFAGMSFHYGIDLANPKANALVLAPADMVITYVGFNHYGYGNWIIAKQVDDPGYIFEFHHFAPGGIKVQKGQIVAAGTPIAVQGTTGNSTGNHLHFQMAPPGTDPTKPTMNQAIDPLPILRKAGVIK